jgi:hypothetical protein
MILFLVMAACICAPAAVAQAQDANSAKQFVESLYKLYAKEGNGVPSSGAHARLYYHSSLLTLMRADEKAVGPGYVGAIDADPVCGCQDWNGVWDLHVDVKMDGADHAVADVTFFLAAPTHRSKDDLRRLSIVLAPESGQWRIWDVRDESDAKNVFDVRDALSKEIQQLKKPAKAQGSGTF